MEVFGLIIAVRDHLLTRAIYLLTRMIPLRSRRRCVGSEEPCGRAEGGRRALTMAALPQQHEFCQPRETASAKRRPTLWGGLS